MMDSPAPIVIKAPACWIAAALFVSGSVLPAPTLAQAGTQDSESGQPAPDSEAASPAAEPATKPAPGGQTYPPHYFERFAPRTALDMIEQVHGFQIESSTGGRSRNGGRGLGQANQNVLVNGERLSSKTDSVTDQLRRIPAKDVVQIEIADATAFDVPGLSGQVANVTVNLEGMSGSFGWRLEHRATSGGLEWFGGEISLAGTRGPFSYTLALANPNRRFGSEGPTQVRNPQGDLIQTEQIDIGGGLDKPRITANLGYDLGTGASATLNLAYARSYYHLDSFEDVTGPAIDANLNTIRRREDGYEYEVSGDLTVPIGAGDLKLIGVERYDFEDFTQSAIRNFEDPALTRTGSRFTREERLGERIARAEYSFPFIGAEWQLAGEAAFNRLDQISGLFEIDSAGDFIEQDFPEGTGGVREDRYEALLSYSKALSARLSVQASAGYEFSTLKQSGSAANRRSFARPKGSASIAWNNGQGLDITLTGERRIGQLSFGDFLASVNIEDNNANAGNNQLVPAQQWEVQLDIVRNWGAWGSTSLMVEQRWIADFITLVPLTDGSEARGNITQARRTEIEWATALKLDRLGLRGVQLDVRLEYEEGELRDPLTGRLRDFSPGVDREADIGLRHDIEGTDLAYGVGMNYVRDRTYFRTQEFNRAAEGPTFARMYAEHKDLFGLTARATLGNLLGGRDRDQRRVFDGPRNTAPLLFTEQFSRRLGLIFRLDVSGNF